MMAEPSDALFGLLFWKTDADVRFQKTGVMLDTGVLGAIAKRISADVDSSVDGVCILATSGLSLGVFLAQVMGKPAFFFRKAGWHSFDTHEQLQILPPVPPGMRLLLVDSHVRTGETLESCLMELALSHATAQEIATLIDLDVLPQDRLHGLRQISAVKLSSFADRLEALGVNIQDLTPDSPLWKPPKAIPYTEIDHFEGRRKSLPYYIVFPWSRLQWDLISEELNSQLSPYNLSSEAGIWSFLSHPLLVGKACSEIASGVNVKQYDVLVGVCPIGTAIALALAYHAGFTGPVIAAYAHPGLLPSRHAVCGKNCLVVQGRLTTGRLSVSALVEVERAGGSCRDLLALRFDMHAMRWLRRLPWKRIAAKGVRVRVASIPRRHG
jgi:orotate phosphoribosyltransferase